MKKYIYLLAALFFGGSTFAQKIWTADIRPVEVSAYYNIELDQRLVGAASSNFADLRILTNNADQASIEVPYFVRSVTPISFKREFETYKLYENSVKDSLNVIVVNNLDQEIINRFYVVYKKADVKIEMGIRGSNNLKQWYVVKRKGNASNHASNGDTDAMLILDFPKGDYKYYEITLSSDQGSPLDVKLVGKMSDSSIYGQFTEIPVGRFTQQEDSNNRTVLSFPTLNDTYRICKIELEVADKVVYMRHAVLYDSLNRASFPFVLSSKDEHTFYFDDFSIQNSTVICIDNKDNPPLHITGVKVYALKRYICAHLDSSQLYTVCIDKQKYTSPSYDIQQFKDELAVNLMETGTTNVSSHVIEPEVRKRLFIEEPLVLWSVIIGLGLFLTYICVKMVVKMKKEEAKEKD